MLANHAPASNDSPQGDSDYEAILAALMQSARGRAFLQEYALRNRVADTETLLSAIGRIEGLLTTRSLEPAAPSSADAAPAIAGDTDALVEIADIEVLVAEADVVIEVNIESEPTEIISDSATAQTERISETRPVTHVPDAAIAALEGTALHALAIEFLGPQVSVPEPAPVAAPLRQEAPAKPVAREPFAEIRTLSDIEKIALFT
jgi:hypothetical protein